MLHEIDNVKIAEHFACAVMYGDHDGLEDSDIALLDEFMARYFMYKPTYVFGESNGDFDRCAVTGLLANCITMEVWAEI